MNQEIQSDSSYFSSDVHFDLINSKLDKLMQIVTLTEKKPSVQMQNLLHLNDKEDEMILFQKQVNLELQNIVNEQNQQLQAYRSQHFQKQIKCENLLMKQQEYFYNENRKLNDTVQYLANENLNIRKQYNELMLFNNKLLNFIKDSTQGQQKESTRQQLEQLGVQIPKQSEEMQAEGNSSSQEEIPEIKLQKKINALERFLVQILSSYKNSTEKEELLNAKNQLEQKIIEMAQLNEQYDTIKKDNEAYIKQLKKAKLFGNNQSKNTKKRGASDNFPLVRKETQGRQTRGKRINYQDIIKEFDEEFDENSQIDIEDVNLSSSQHSSDQSPDNHKQAFLNNKKIHKKSGYDSQEDEDSMEEQKNKKQQVPNKQIKNKAKQSSRTVTSDEEQSEDEDDDDDFIDDKENGNNKRKLIKNSVKKDNINDTKRKKKTTNYEREIDEDISDFEESLSELNSESGYSSEESYSDSGKKRKQQLQQKQNTNNNKSDSKQAIQKQPKVIPEKKKVVTQNRKKPSKKVLKKNQETQDRLFNQLDMILDM